MRMAFGFFYLFLYLCLGSQATAADLFKVGPISAQPGQSVSGFIEIPEGVDSGTKIPVSVVHGAEKGPVLALIAGTHGYEYAPIVALHRVRANLDPEALFGTVIIVHIANLPSFLSRTIYYSPVDGKNLNRVYPGDAQGTVSERIAYAITKEVIEQADRVVDLHSGDGNEALRPYIYMPVTGRKKLDRGSRELALAFGLDHIVVDESRVREQDDSLYTDMTALSRGIPAITTETGQLGSTDDHWVNMAEQGVWNLLKSLDMMVGDSQTNGNVVWLEKYEVVTSPQDGVFEARVKDGYAVSKGTTLGVLKDFFGNPVEEILAPFPGVVNYIVATPPVKKDEPLAMLSRIREE